MVFLRRWLPVALSLMFSGRAVHAAATADGAFEIAARAFSDLFWENAEEDFGNFVRDFPNSPRVPEAILYEAEARFYLRKYAGAISLLSTNQNRAGGLADLYLYWIAESHYQNTNYAAAADAFARIVRMPGSTNRIRACVGEAGAYARLGEWNRTTELLQQPAGVFQQLAKASPNDPSVAFGYLLLGEAQLAETNYAGCELAVAALAGVKVNPELNWRRLHLECRLQESQGRLDEALVTASNLLAATEAMPQPKSQAEADASEGGMSFAEWFGAISPGGFRAESLSRAAAIQERLNRLDDAIGTYQQLIFTNAPSSQQRRALLKIVELRLKQERIGDAVRTLERYVEQFPRSKAIDVALLNLGELQLKQYLTRGNSAGTNESPAALSETNLLGQALAKFDHLLDVYSNSPVAGRALLDKGWCLWMGGQFTQSEAAFRLAAARATAPEDLAVARFKWADAQFKQGDFAGALTNYNFLAAQYGSVPEVAEKLLEGALYQTVQCAFEVNDMASASNALHRILTAYPDGFAADRGLLLTGEGYARQHNPSRARELFSEFEKRYPKSPLLPETRLAIARTYEQQKDWVAAITIYEAWTNDFPKDPKLPQAAFYHGWDYYMAGQETNALSSFTNFVARFPTNALAQQAQWWIGSYYFGISEYRNAELNYQLVYINTNWPSSDLNFPAQMMAGVAAAARLSYSDAIRDYFQPLASNTNCPVALRMQARFAWGDALMSRDSTNKLVDLREAIRVFSGIPGTNELGPKALGRVGDAYLQLPVLEPQQSAADYASASNCYWQVSLMTNASVATRSQAKVGLGAVAEARARQQTGPEQTALLNEALTHYLNVFNDDKSDPIWRKNAGLNAASVAEALKQWPQSVNVLRRMQELFPPLRASLENKISRAMINSAEEKKK